MPSGQSNLCIAESLHCSETLDRTSTVIILRFSPKILALHSKVGIDKAMLCNISVSWLILLSTGQELAVPKYVIGIGIIIGD